MIPKEVVQKGYESFAAGDMGTIKSLMHEEAVIKVNGMQKFLGPIMDLIASSMIFLHTFQVILKILKQNLS